MNKSHGLVNGSVRGHTQSLKMDDQTLLDCIEFAKKSCNITFELKEKQVECIRHVVGRRDTIGLLPTGFGKSLIYTLLPCVLDRHHRTDIGHHIVVVISPLVALMEEQVIKISDYGISAVYLGSTIAPARVCPDLV